MVILENPPSIVISAPVTKLDASDASHNIAPINSSGLPYLFIGVWSKIDFSLIGVIKFFLFHSVGKKPGFIEFTLTPSVAHSLAKF